MSLRVLPAAVPWCCALVLCAQGNDAEGIRKQISGLRKLPDETRAQVTKDLALAIRRLPIPATRVNLALALANYSTEGDFGRNTLQKVAATLAEALREYPLPAENGRPAPAYRELAALSRYEHVQAALDDPQFAAAVSELESIDRLRSQADFTLQDLQGNHWTLSRLRGKVVLVNFWATWCPPCRKEMPDLEALYRRFKDSGLVILAISDEEADQVKRFLQEAAYTYPVLLDPGRKVNQQFRIEGIPKSFVYDRNGRLVAQAIDMRTKTQFLEMLRQAGLP
jgi:peroxiredoxin